MRDCRIIAAAAAATEQLRIGFSVLVVPLRPAPWLAAQVATLQHLSGNRLQLGVGSGGFPDNPFWHAVGVPGRDRGRVTDAILDMLPRLLIGEPVELNGSLPPLVQAPAAMMPPLLVGGTEHAFRRVLRHGADWFPSLISPAGLARAVERLRETAVERGVPMPGVTVGGHLIVGDDANARGAHDAFVRNLVEVHGLPPEQAPSVPMRARTPHELAEVFAEFHAAGADRVVVGADNLDWMQSTEFLAAARAAL